jgi:hypothetical protein
VVGCAEIATPDTAFETEIARLQGENASLKKQMIARGVSLGHPARFSGSPTADRAETAERSRYRPDDDVHGKDLASSDRYDAEHAKSGRQEGLSGLRF